MAYKSKSAISRQEILAEYKRRWNYNFHKGNSESRKKIHREYYSSKKETLNEQCRLNYSFTRPLLEQYHPHPNPNHSWKSPELVREYFESLGKQLRIAHFTDWYRISRSQVGLLGGKSLFRKFETLGHALHYAYPEYDWDLEKFLLRGKKSGQRWLRALVGELLPGTAIEENYQTPDLTWGNTLRLVELDIWLPEHRIGIEYHGEHHYCSLDAAFGPNGTAGLFSERDIGKATLCRSRGITLIMIPYWWNGERDSLSATLYCARPDVFPLSTAAPIPGKPTLSKLSYCRSTPDPGQAIIE